MKIKATYTPVRWLDGTDAIGDPVPVTIVAILPSQPGFIAAAVAISLGEKRLIQDVITRFTDVEWLDR